MSILRIEHNKDNPYVILNKKILEDKNLSWEAKGLWSYLMSRPDNWVVSVSHLKTIFESRGGGEKAIYSILNELIANGYCIRSQSKAAAGRFSKTEYVITELKKCLPHSLQGDAAQPSAVNQPTNNNRVQQSTDRYLDKDNVSAPTLKKTMPLYPKKEKYKDLNPATRWRLTEIQQETFFWLQGLQINTDEGTLAFWSKSYSLDRLHNVYECAKSNSSKNVGGYMNKLLKSEAVVENQNSKTNKESARQFQQETQSNNMEILEKYLKINLNNGGTEEIPYNIDPLDFYRKMAFIQEIY